jgi:hypothetical protein
MKMEFKSGEITELTIRKGNDVVAKFTGKLEPVNKEEPTPEPKFKKGDIICGNAESDKKYGVTTSDMTKGRVIEVYNDGTISVEVMEHKNEDYKRCIGDTHNVEEKYFDLVVDEPKAEKQPEQRPFTPGDRVRVKKTGEVGTFRGYHILLSTVGVEFDTPVSGRHNFQGSLENGYEGKDGCCWYYGIDEIELLSSNQCPEPKTLVASETYTFKDNKTTCIIEIDGRKFKGYAKCSPDDEWNEEIGMKWAKIRANRKMLDAAEQELRG